MNLANYKKHVTRAKCPQAQSQFLSDVMPALATSDLGSELRR
jgi:hypothetical protein